MPKLNIDNYKLCMELLSAESEKEISNILTKYNLLKKSDWQFFGGIENNFGTISNQQSEPEAALVEKLVNSHDAVLLLHCKLNDIDPESDNAPQNIEMALEKFLNIPRGDLSELTVKERKELANNIGLIATGKKSSPNFIIFDRGEGQTPNKFKDTFLSLNKSNKLRIPFVQGTYNMGGTGVQRFCGEQNYQLIISKRHPIILEEVNENDSDWGFTLIRRFDPVDGMKHSTYKFLAPKRKILSFSKEEISIPLKNLGTQEIFPLKSGSIIKLYNYELARSLKTMINFDLYNRISLLLPKIGIPIRFYERRRYKGHSMESTMSGLYVRLEDDRRDNIEEGFPSSFQFKVKNENFKAKIYVFKKDSDEKYRKNEGVVFSINGQAHGFIKTNVFKSKSNLTYLADSILVILDCNNLSQRSKEILFMASRDRLAKNPLNDEIEKELIKILKDHPELRRLNNQRRADLITEKGADSKPLEEVISSLIKNSPSLQALFIQGGDFSNPYKSVNAKPVKKFMGKKYPTFFKIKKGHEDNVCHINNRIRIKFETDVVNDYFSRTFDPGEFELLINGKSSVDSSLNLWNGIATLNITIPKELKVGDEISGEFLVIDNSRIEPIVNKFHRIIEDEVSASGGKSGKRDSTGETGKGDKIQPDKLALPQVIHVKEDEWANYSFDEFSALMHKGTLESGYDFFVNVDNKYLKHEIKQLKMEDESELIIQKFSTSMVLIGLAILQDRENYKEDSERKHIKEIEDTVFIISRALAPVVIPMIDSLSKLAIE